MAALLGTICERLSLQPSSEAMEALRRQVESRMLYLLQNANAHDMHRYTFAVTVLSRSISASNAIDGLDQLIAEQIVQFFVHIANAKVLGIASSLMLTLIRHRQSLMQPHFLDIIDVVLGWLLDFKCSEELRVQLNEFLCESSVYWMSHPQAGVEMLDRLVSFLQRPPPSSKPTNSVDADSVIRCFVSVVSGIVRCYPPPDVVTPSIALMGALERTASDHEMTVLSSAIEGLNKAILSGIDRQSLFIPAIRLTLMAYGQGCGHERILSILNLLEKEFSVDEPTALNATEAVALLLSSNLIDVCSRHHNPLVFCGALVFLHKIGPLPLGALSERFTTASSDRQTSFFVYLLPIEQSFRLYLGESISLQSRLLSPNVVSVLVRKWSLQSSPTALRVCVHLLQVRHLCTIHHEILRWLASTMEHLSEADSSLEANLSSILALSRTESASTHTLKIRAITAMNASWAIPLRSSLLMRALYLLPPASPSRRLVCQALGRCQFAVVPIPCLTGEEHRTVPVPSWFIGSHFIAALDKLTVAMSSKNDLLETARICAAFIIQERLKTPCGPPLATLEELVSRISKSLSSAPSNAFGMVVLLGEIERQVERSTSAFFQTNRRVCRSFFSRIREQLMTASATLAEPSFLIEHSSLRLSELQQQPEFDSIAYTFASLQQIDAARRARQGIDTIRALQAELVDAVSSVALEQAQASFIEAVALHSGSDFVPAAEQYAAAIQETSTCLPMLLQEQAWSGLAECAVHLERWNIADSELLAPETLAEAIQSKSPRIRACADVVKHCGELLSRFEAVEQALLPSDAYQLASSSCSEGVLCDAAALCCESTASDLVIIANDRLRMAGWASRSRPSLEDAAMFRRSGNRRMWDSVMISIEGETDYSTEAVAIERSLFVLSCIPEVSGSVSSVLDYDALHRSKLELSAIEQVDAALLFCNIADIIENADVVEAGFERAKALCSCDADFEKTWGCLGRWCADEASVLMGHTDPLWRYTGPWNAKPGTVYPRKPHLEADGQTERESRARQLQEVAASAMVDCLRISGGVVAADAMLLMELMDSSVEIDSTKLLETPSRCWSKLVPQLFALARHDNSTRSGQVCDLLAGPVLDIAPEEVMFSLSELVSSKDSPIAWSRPDVFNPLAARVRQRQPALFEQLEKFAASLRRISLLWGEEWLSHIRYLTSEVPRRLSLWAEECNGITADGVDSRLCYKAIFSSLFILMDDLEKRTLCEPPRTRYQKQFLTTHRGMLSTCLRLLRLPLYKKVPPSSAEAMALQFGTIFGRLASSLSQSLHLSIESLCEWLAATSYFGANLLRVAGMPAGTVVECIHRRVEVLPTKTRPKKLLLQGSDGLQHAYLLKAHEDLHQDQRLLQFIDFADTMLRSSSSSSTLRARTYAVVPLSRKVAFLRLVDHATPLYELYRRFQHATSDSTTPDPPAAIFQKRLGAALTTAGLPTTTPRTAWPRAIVLGLYEQLRDEARASGASSLLERELLASSSDACDAFQRRRVFAGSTAMLSMVGSVVGLGDRHLGNILLGQRSGELVHIDLNLAFDCGRALRVPERVPFRLTPMIRFALRGLPFQSMCEETMQCLRRHRSPLLVVLNALRLAPLREWSPLTDTLSRSRLQADLDMAMGILLLHVKTQRKHGLLLDELIQAASALEVAKCASSRDALGEAFQQYRRVLDRAAKSWRLLRPLLSIVVKALRPKRQSRRRRADHLGLAALDLKVKWDELHLEITALGLAQSTDASPTVNSTDTAAAAALVQCHKDDAVVDELDDENPVTEEDGDLEDDAAASSNRQALSGLAHAVSTAWEELEAALTRTQSDHLEVEGHSDLSARGRSLKAQRVLKVVEHKLSGLGLSVQEQVRSRIAEATDHSRLADMYEGWASWI